MIIFKGKKYDTLRQSELLDRLPEEIMKTLEKKPPESEMVMQAVSDVLKNLEEDENFSGYFNEYGHLLKSEYLNYKLNIELPELNDLNEYGKLERKRVPLGVLLHIAAGNVEMLPAYSVLEGLLTGNVNILKLPSSDDGITVSLLSLLTEKHPFLAEYIYVFDTPSVNVKALKKMERVADAVVVWGSDEAITAVRKLAAPDTKIIEWGHKASFAYLSGDYRKMDLTGLAHNILKTKGQLCSSCQVIYLDTDRYGDISDFCRWFSRILDECGPVNEEVSSTAESTLRRQARKLEKIISGKEMYIGSGYCLIPGNDSELEINEKGTLVKPLKRETMIKTIAPHKGHVQTVGLLCEEDDREEITQLLMRSKVNRICDPFDMSEFFPGENHDGEYALNRYVRVVDIMGKERW